MPVTIPDQAKLNWFRLQATQLMGNTAVRLFANDLTITEATTLADITQCTFPGYAPAAPPGWSFAAINAQGLAVSVTADLLWTRGAGGSPQTIYGIYLTWVDGVTNKLLWVEKNKIPFTMDVAGRAYRRRVFFNLHAL
jgi:hypothetical protein